MLSELVRDIALLLVIVLGFGVLLNGIIYVWDRIFTKVVALFGLKRDFIQFLRSKYAPKRKARQ